MKYDLMTPCANCPFRHDLKSGPFIASERCEEILMSNAEFACHKTLDYDGDETDEEGFSEAAELPTTQHCAGVLIILEREERPHQMMRIMERLGGYDRSKLNMDAPVYDSIEEAISVHEEAEV